MKTLRLWAAAPVTLLGAAVAAAAQPCMGPACGYQCRANHGGDCEAAYRDNSMWPNQYIGPSRRGICQSFDLMVANGWRRHNLLGPQDFERNSNQLSEAGKLKVQWILTQAPATHRTIFVERSLNQEQTAERLESVQQLAAEYSNGGAAADVRDTHVRNHGHPASMVDAVFTGFSAAQPSPMLPPSSTGGGASAGAATN